ncbi:MAG: alpha/beta fold hydrolase [Dehalococcoidia bacterium]
MPAKLALAALAAGVAGAGVAADLWARRAIRRFESVNPEDADVPGSRFWIRGVAVHYVERGQGFPIVLVHGFGGSTFSYRFLVSALAKDFRVVAVDLPGFGYSGRGAHTDYSQSGWVELLAEFLSRLGIQRAVFVGHSLGGAVVERLAVVRPELVERLVLVSAVSAAEPPRTPPVDIGPVVRVVQGAMASRQRGYERMSRNVAFDPAFMRGPVLDGYLRPLRLPGTAAAIRKLMSDARRDRPIDLSRIRVPVLLLWGAHDRVVKPAVGERLHAAIAGSRLKLIPEAGHLPLEEQPELCNRLIAEFLADLRQPARAAGSATDTPASNGGKV